MLELEFTPVSPVVSLGGGGGGQRKHKAIEADAKSKNMDEAFEEFLNFDVACGAASIDTVRNYKSQVKLFLQWCLDTQTNPLLADKRHIQQYRKYLIDVRKFKSTTIGLKLNVVRRFYDALIAHNMTTSNPAMEVKAPRNRRSVDNVKYLELDQLKQLIKLTEGDDIKSKRDRVIIGLMALQGLRTIEVQKLKFGNLIDQGGKHYLLVSAKRAERRIKLRDDVHSWLVSSLAGKRLTSNLPIITSLSGNNYGHSISRTGLRQSVNSYLKTIGLRNGEIMASNHALRHTFGTQVYAATKDIRLVQEALGHNDPKTTARYAHIVDGVDAADCIEI